MIDLARSYVDAGISVIAVRLDGSKAPAVPSWKTYQERFATDGELTHWFERPAALGVIAGVVSSGLEIIDFDAGELFEPWRQAVESIVCRLPIVETPSGGYHVYYRCAEISGNHKIACDPKREKQTLIETRGQGGYVVGAGSPAAAHSANVPYVQVAGPTLPDVPTIAKPERVELWKAARVFDKAAVLEKYRATELRGVNASCTPSNQAS